jgi:glycosyltransferase involved in cell wall biosynthesis
MPGQEGKLKVLMIGTLPSDLQSIKGGVEAAIINLFSGFSRMNTIDVVHVAFIKGLENGTEFDYAPNVKIYFLPFKSPYQLIDFFLNRATLKQIISKESPHIVHFQESEPHLLRLAGFPRRSVVVTQHGIMLEELKYARGLFDKLKYLFKACIERFVFPMFRNIIFISDYNRKLFAGKQQIQSANIYNAVNPVFFENRVPRSSVEDSIIYVGVINRRKNLKLAIEALAELKSRNIVYILHVVGGYKDSTYQQEITRLVHKLGVADQLKFYGWLKQTEILQVYDQCNYYILPSLQETLPVSIAEAMALGKVVIASDVGAVAEMFENQTTGFLFRKDDRDHLVEVLELLHRTKPLTPEFSAKIKQEAKEKYHPDTNAKMTFNFYQEVIHHNQPS